MDDPWNVKSVRRPGQYISCMKINGVPLLPPVLSKECRQEMQYYKLLAKEVEKRIALLEPLTTDTDTDEENSVIDLPDGQQDCKLSTSNSSTGLDIDIDQISTNNNSVSHKTLSPEKKSSEYTQPITRQEDKSVDINSNCKMTKNSPPTSLVHSSPITDIPERDFSYPTKDHEQTKMCDLEMEGQKNRKNFNQINNNTFYTNKSPNNDLFVARPKTRAASAAWSSKSFTGSLVDIHAESLKDRASKSLVRQRSYTVLHPSPQLMAHLEVQSLNTGVALTSISMSESMSNLSPSKKRRSWDLETAKSKWSSMAVELKNKERNIARTQSVKQRKPRAQSSDRYKRVVTKQPKSDPLPIKKEHRDHIANETVCKEKTSLPFNTKIPVIASLNETYNTNGKVITNKTQSEPDSLDPASRIRELYERIQNQQLVQMANLVEKQKKEQILLQQVFEEQNALLYRQLKTICPKSPLQAKLAWTEVDDSTTGPVSLSQLMKTPEPSLASDTTLSSTLTDTKKHLRDCDEILKRSRDISSSLKKKPGDELYNSSQGSVTRTHSPVISNSPKRTPRRKIVYESSSSERECEPIMTDRTNDTMADVNVTFSTDDSGNERFYSNNNTVINQMKQNNVTLNGVLERTTTNDAINSMIASMQKQYQECAPKTPMKVWSPPTEQERRAATKLVAAARGFLTRRLMATERVQATVQTIKDALLCALQLHQDHEGIRGADVDLHRRLIQQITAACYSLHETVVASTPSQRCAVLAGDRARRAARAARPPNTPRRSYSRSSDVMSQSHSGAFPARAKRSSLPAAMTQSNHETFSDASRRSLPTRRRPWR